MCRKKEIHPSDQQGLITKKPSESAQGAISPQEAGVNQDLAQQITGLTNQSDAIAEQHDYFNAATSVINYQQACNTEGVPTVIQINQTFVNASNALGSGVCKEMPNAKNSSMSNKSAWARN